jgi:hypothetical protein
VPLLAFNPVDWSIIFTNRMLGSIIFAPVYTADPYIATIVLNDPADKSSLESLWITKFLY